MILLRNMKANTSSLEPEDMSYPEDQLEDFLFGDPDSAPDYDNWGDQECEPPNSDQYGTGQLPNENWYQHGMSHDEQEAFVNNYLNAQQVGFPFDNYGTLITSRVPELCSFNCPIRVSHRC